MKSQPKTLERREFLRLMGTGAIAAYAAGELNPVYASGGSGDDVLKKPELLTAMGDVWKKYKPLMEDQGKYELSLDMNGDGREETVTMKLLKDKSILEGVNPNFGDMFLIKIGPTEISGILRGDDISIIKTFWSMDGEVPGYFDALLKHTIKK